MKDVYAPYRVSLFGGGTDYPEWYMRKGGVAVNFTIQGGIRVSVKREEDELTKQVIQASGRDSVQIVTTADYPRESGLGGSAAYAVAVALALRQYDVRNKMELAEYGFQLERRVGRMVGFQDHLAAVYGAHRVFWFRTGGEIETEYLQIEEKDLRDMCNHMMLLPVPRQEAGSEVAKRYQGVDMERTYQRALMGLAALEKKDWPKVGYELERAWEEKKEWAEGVSNPAIDFLIYNASRMGAWGCKLLGAGSGGFVLVMAEDTQELYGRLLRRGYHGNRFGVEPDMQGIRWVKEGEVMTEENVEPLGIA